MLTSRAKELRIGVAVACTLLSGAALMSMYSKPINAAEPQERLQRESRYLMSTWAYPSGTTGNGGSNSSFGAYVLDSHTGKVWVIIEKNKPHEIGILR